MGVQSRTQRSTTPMQPRHIYISCSAMSARENSCHPLPQHKTKLSTEYTDMATSTVKDSQSAAAGTATAAPRPLQTSTTQNGTYLSHPQSASTSLGWGAPAGLGIRGSNDENLVVFRKALGINYQRAGAADGGTLEEGRRSAVGIYASVIRAQQSKRTAHTLVSAFLYLCYFAQIIVGAALTALGPMAAQHTTVITVLGAVNTVVAGVLALIKGSGQPMKLGKDRIGYRRLQDWIEETEALLAVGVIGCNEREVGLLVETAFRRYNAAKLSDENNDPDYYVNQPVGPSRHHAGNDSEQAAHGQ
ncbi:hypothetical protein GGR56DRAFT_635564 [Xylariaceae sp. FL0804]|nr:hypothetical protein GGR56DRAFT_635564 [Xylariaceae sp. FL0804]